MMEKTKTIKKTYTQREVDEYLKKMLSSSELALSEQRDRIVELKNQIDKLKGQLDEAKEKTKVVSKAMNEASRLTKEFKKESDLRRKIELEKIRAFGYRWKTYLDQLFSSVPQLDGNKSNILFEQEMIEILDEMQALDEIKETKEDRILLSKKNNKFLTEQEWLEDFTKNSENTMIQLSEENEKRYNELMKELKDDMTFASMLNAPSENFDLGEALNPKDDLNKIIGDLL